MPGIDVQRAYRQIRAFYEEAGRMLDWPEARLTGRVPEVSGWSAAQHLDHLAKANGRALKALRLLAEGKLPVEAGRTALWARLLLAAGRLPRGAQAPENVLPAENPTPAELARSLARNREALSALEPHLLALSRHEGRFRHPRLGLLNAKQWLRFVDIHSTHHLKIIRKVTSRL